jgi:hypothetical protein
MINDFLIIIYLFNTSICRKMQKLRKLRGSEVQLEKRHIFRI